MVVPSMPQNDDRDGRDPGAPPAPVADDATQRRLVKARELLREARSRLSSRDDAAVDAPPDLQLTDDDGE